jgi:DNA-damage-inducible protein J
MSSVLVQFRTEDKAKAKASSICERLGLDLQSYLRMCISRMNQENGIPFSMNVNDLPKNRGLEAMKEASRIAEKNGIADMTLEEINAEIDSVRKRDNK